MISTPTLLTSDPVRSKIMRSVRRRDTAPELAVRRALHRLGFRFRLQRKDLPGTPDIVLPGLKTAIFVHGCFWHRHVDCSRATMPRSRADFWSQKFEANVTRDRRNEAALSQIGWRIITIWECEARNVADLKARLGREIGVSSNRPEHGANREVEGLIPSPAA